MTPNPWNSLEVATLVVAALTPVAVVALGVLVARYQRRNESVQHANRTVVAARLEVFQKLAPDLNRLFCFAFFVGRWKAIEPREALELKRSLDEVVYSNRLLFSDQLLAAYHAFMATVFRMWAATDADALIRCGISSQWGDRRHLPWWRPELEQLFATTDPTTPEQAEAAHNALMAAFRADLYVTDLTRPLPSSTP